MDEAGVWLTISELARERGVNKSAVSRRVERLEKLGLIKTRPGRARTKLVLRAEFDRATEETVDAVREANGNAGDDARTDPVLSKEQARRASYDADLKKLELDERLGALVPVDGVREAAATCGEQVIRIVEQLPTRADEISGKHCLDVVAVRTVLRAAAPALRDQIAQAMTLLAAVPQKQEETA